MDDVELQKFLEKLETLRERSIMIAANVGKLCNEIGSIATPKRLQ